METSSVQYRVINYDDVENKLGFFVTYLWEGSQAQTISYYGPIFTAPFPCEVLSVSERHQTANAVGATFGLYRITSGTSPDSATNPAILVTNFDLQGTADTTILKTKLDLTANRFLNATDSLGGLTTGTLTTVTGVHVTVYLRPLGRGQFR